MLQFRLSHLCRARRGLLGKTAAFAADDRGSATEFAIVSSLIFMTIGGSMQIGYDVFRTTLLSETVQNSARMIQLGRAPTNLRDFKNAMCNSIPLGLSCKDLHYDISVTTGFYSYVDTHPTPNDGVPRQNLKPINLNHTSTCTGGAGSFVVIRAVYLASLITPFWPGPTIMVNGKRATGLTATAVIKNEPFLGVRKPLPGC